MLCTAAVAQSGKRPELRFLYEAQLYWREFDSGLLHKVSGSHSDRESNLYLSMKKSLQSPLWSKTRIDKKSYVSNNLLGSGKASAAVLSSGTSPGLIPRSSRSELSSRPSGLVFSPCAALLASCRCLLHHSNEELTLNSHMSCEL